jgi:hypothetical protein
METGSFSSDSVEVIEVDGPDLDQDVTVYEGWVRSCPQLPPTAGAELLARAVVALGNHPVSPAVTPSLQYWAAQRPRIPARLLADLIAAETPSRGATYSANVRNEATPNRGTPAMGNDLTPNKGTLHLHAMGFAHPFDQVQHTIVPVFTLGNRMIAWREALTPRVDDAAEPPDSDTSVGGVGLANLSA